MMNTKPLKTQQLNQQLLQQSSQRLTPTAAQTVFNPQLQHAHMRPALGLAGTMLLCCGLLYSVSVTAIGGWFFPGQANGSLLSTADNSFTGSALIAQPFSAAHYFHGRPSSVGTDPMSTGGSNLAPSNPALRERVAATSAELTALYQVAATELPVDLLASSGSGVDPHISPAAAALQLARVATARGIPHSALETLLQQQIEGPQFGLLGEPRVNVLLLNLALDQQFPLSK